VPGFGNDIIDIGMGVYDLDKNGKNDVLIMGISPTQILFRVGYNMDANGNADFSSPIKTMMNVSGSIIGGGLDVNYTSSTFVVGYYINDAAFARLHTTILPWDFTNQAFGAATDSYVRESVGLSGNGGGVSIGDLDGDFKNDILSMAYVGGAFRFVVDYTYEPSSHEELLRGICGAHTN
jgi:hypothetical protein